MFCQKCRQPLKLDSSLGDLNPAAFDLLICEQGPPLEIFLGCYLTACASLVITTDTKEAVESAIIEAIDPGQVAEVTVR